MTSVPCASPTMTIPCPTSESPSIRLPNANSANSCITIMEK